VRSADVVAGARARIAWLLAAAADARLRDVPGPDPGEDAGARLASEAEPSLRAARPAGERRLRRNHHRAPGHSAAAQGHVAHAKRARCLRSVARTAGRARA